MKTFNLSDWAIEHRSLVWYFMIAFMFAGLFSYFRLGREEDPAFTIKTMVVQAFWPGGLSLVVQQAPSLAWDLGDTRGTVMLRMPLHPVALDLLREIGPMAVSSANVSGEPPATTVQDARNQLGSQVDVYLDGGPCAEATPSTIVDLTGERPRVLREGAVTVEAVAEVLGCEVAELRSA